MLVRVATGIILRDQKVFLALRKAKQHQGGLWEFPGGKCEEGESVRFALCRELREECGIEVQKCEFFKTLNHNYGDKQVELSFFTVTAFVGEPTGKEGQEISWVSLPDIVNYSFPKANEPIVEFLLQTS